MATRKPRVKTPSENREAVRRHRARKGPQALAGAAVAQSVMELTRGKVRETLRICADIAEKGMKRAARDGDAPAAKSNALLAACVMDLAERKFMKEQSQRGGAPTAVTLPRDPDEPPEAYARLLGFAMGQQDCFDQAMATEWDWAARINAHMGRATAFEALAAGREAVDVGDTEGAKRAATMATAASAVMRALDSTTEDA